MTHQRHPSFLIIALLWSVLAISPSPGGFPLAFATESSQGIINSISSKLPFSSSTSSLTEEAQNQESLLSNSENNQVETEASTAKTESKDRSKKKKSNKTRYKPFAFVSRLFRRATTEEEYRKLLEQQIQELEVALRSVKEEARQLRQKLSAATMKSIRNTFGSEVVSKASQQFQKQLAEERAHFEKEIERLLYVVKDLETAKQKLEVALELEKQVGQEKQNLLEAEKLRASQNEASFKQKLNSLQSEFQQQSKSELAKLEQNMSTQFTKEVERMIAKHAAALEDERKRAEAAVEAERAKMRRLVKAVAEKEAGAIKKLDSKSKGQIENVSSKRATNLPSGSTFSEKETVPSVRGRSK